MRSYGLVGLAVIVAGITSLAQQARGEMLLARNAAAVAVATPPARVAAQDAIEPTPARPSATSVPRVGVVQERERVQEASNGARDRRSYRGRSRNRYPGPIPTPADWVPPEGPIRIALQAGHWRANEAPRELSGLRGNGTAWRGTAEWETNLDIAERAGAMLRGLGYEVDILPAVVPPGYRAHLFIAIHADGSSDPAASGYRVAAPRRDATGRAGQLVDLLQESYGEATGLRELGTVTRRMQNYYAFNFRRYEHALHPMTIAVIIETGFVTSARDRSVIMDAPDRAAQGIVDAVTAFPVTALPDPPVARPLSPHAGEWVHPSGSRR